MLTGLRPGRWSSHVVLAADARTKSDVSLVDCDDHEAKCQIPKVMVPKKGLEPPHPCGYMDLNHARLPIPPLRQRDAPDDDPARRRELHLYCNGNARSVKQERAMAARRRPQGKKTSSAGTRSAVRAAHLNGVNSGRSLRLGVYACASLLFSPAYSATLCVLFCKLLPCVHF